MPSETPHENPGFVVTLGDETISPWWPVIPSFSPNGEILALVSENVTLWDLDTKNQIFELERPYSRCYTENVAFSDDSSLLAASIYCVLDENNFGCHLLVWDTIKGILLQDWKQGFADTAKLSEYAIFYPATGIAFSPNSSLLAFANGNTIEIRDVRHSNQPAKELSLGDEMVASKISISNDGKQLFAFMNFDNDRGRTVTKKFTLQVWDLIKYDFYQDLIFPESQYNWGVVDDERNLIGHYLAHIDNVNGIFKLTNMEKQEEIELPYRLGKRYLSPDAKYLLYIPKDVSHPCKLREIELWDVNSGQNIYTFNTSKTNFASDWCHGPVNIMFNHDNTFLAIGHTEQVSLWDISAFTKPQSNVKP